MLPPIRKPTVRERAIVWVHLSTSSTQSQAKNWLYSTFALFGAVLVVLNARFLAPARVKPAPTLIGKGLLIRHYPTAVARQFGPRRCSSGRIAPTMERYHIFKLGLAVLFYATYCTRPMMMNELSNKTKDFIDDDFVFYQGRLGKPGVDFPVLSHIPRTGFSCKELESGYYADMDTDCQVFHICDEGKKVSFLCPNGTIFAQSELICEWWFKVNCTDSALYYEESAEQLREDNARRKASRRVLPNGNHGAVMRMEEYSTVSASQKGKNVEVKQPQRVIKKVTLLSDRSDNKIENHSPNYRVTVSSGQGAVPARRKDRGRSDRITSNLADQDKQKSLGGFQGSSETGKESSTGDFVEISTKIKDSTSGIRDNYSFGPNGQQSRGRSKYQQGRNGESKSQALASDQGNTQYNGFNGNTAESQGRTDTSSQDSRIAFGRNINQDYQQDRNGGSKSQTLADDQGANQYNGFNNNRPESQGRTDTLSQDSKVAFGHNINQEYQQDRNRGSKSQTVTDEGANQYNAFTGNGPETQGRTDTSSQSSRVTFGRNINKDGTGFNQLRGPQKSTSGDVGRHETVSGLNNGNDFASGSASYDQQPGVNYQNLNTASTSSKAVVPEGKGGTEKDKLLSVSLTPNDLVTKRLEPSDSDEAQVPQETASFYKNSFNSIQQTYKSTPPPNHRETYSELKEPKFYATKILSAISSVTPQYLTTQPINNGRPFIGSQIGTTLRPVPSTKPPFTFEKISFGTGRSTESPDASLFNVGSTDRPVNTVSPQGDRNGETSFVGTANTGAAFGTGNFGPGLFNFGSTERPVDVIVSNLNVGSTERAAAASTLFNVGSTDSPLDVTVSNLHVGSTERASGHGPTAASTLFNVGSTERTLVTTEAVQTTTNAVPVEVFNVGNTDGTIKPVAVSTVINKIEAGTTSGGVPSTAAPTFEKVSFGVTGKSAVPTNLFNIDGTSGQTTNLFKVGGTSGTSGDGPTDLFNVDGASGLSTLNRFGGTFGTGGRPTNSISIDGTSGLRTSNQFKASGSETPGDGTKLNLLGKTSRTLELATGTFDGTSKPVFSSRNNLVPAAGTSKSHSIPVAVNFQSGTTLNGIASTERPGTFEKISFGTASNAKKSNLFNVGDTTRPSAISNFGTFGTAKFGGSGQSNFNVGTTQQPEITEPTTIPVPTELFNVGRTDETIQPVTISTVRPAGSVHLTTPAQGLFNLGQGATTSKPDASTRRIIDHATVYGRFVKEPSTTPSTVEKAFATPRTSFSPSTRFIEDFSGPAAGGSTPRTALYYQSGNAVEPGTSKFRLQTSSTTNFGTQKSGFGISTGNVFDSAITKTSSTAGKKYLPLLGSVQSTPSTAPGFFVTRNSDYGKSIRTTNVPLLDSNTAKGGEILKPRPFQLPPGVDNNLPGVTPEINLKGESRFGVTEDIISNSIAPTYPTYKISSASPFTGSTQAPTQPTPLGTTLSSTFDNIDSMINALAEMANENDYSGETPRPGLVVPPSAGPQTLHTLAVYFANALDGIAADKEEPEEDLENMTQQEIEKKRLTALLTQMTMNRYNELFNEKEVEGTTLPATADIDLEGQHSKNPAQEAPRVRQLAKVFTQALSSYLDDPATFKRVLEEVRPTEPPSQDDTNSDDELLNFSDADSKSSYPPVFPTAPSVRPTWGYIVAFNTSQNLDVKNSLSSEHEGLQGADTQSFVSQFNKLKAATKETSTKSPIALPDGHWTTSPGATKLWSSAFSFNPAFINHDFGPTTESSLTGTRDEAVEPEAVVPEEAGGSQSVLPHHEIQYDLRALPKLSLNSTQVHGILIDFMNTTKSDNNTNRLQRILKKLNTTEDEFLTKMKEIETNPLTRRLILLLISECGTNVTKEVETQAVPLNDLIDRNLRNHQEEVLEAAGTVAGFHPRQQQLRQPSNSNLKETVDPSLEDDSEDVRALQLLNSLYKIASQFGK